MSRRRMMRMWRRRRMMWMRSRRRSKGMGEDK